MTEVGRMKHTLSIIVNDQPGVLLRIAEVFFRHKLNIDSMTVGGMEEAGLSCVTITSGCNEAKIELITKQLCKLIDVLEVRKIN